MFQAEACKGIYAVIDRIITPLVEASRALPSRQGTIMVEYFQDFRAGRT